MKTNMRQMKARQMGKLPRQSPAESSPHCPESDDEPELTDDIQDGIIAHQNDGTFFVLPRRRSASDEDRDRDCPDDAPPGWAEP